MTETSRPRTIPVLTGLRGFGALWVVLYHLQAFDDGALGRLGYLGVDLFFLLSGVVLTYVHAKDFAAVTPGGYGRFLALRLARIYPLHLAILLLMGAAFLLAPSWFQEQADRAHVLSAGAFVANIFLIQNWVPRFSGTWNLPTWSISVEWAAYLVFPFLMRPVQAVRSPPLAMALGLAGIGVFAAGCMLTHHPDPNLILKAGFVRMAAEFLAGCLLCRAAALGLRVSAAAGWVVIAAIALSVWPLHQSPFLAIPGFMILLVLAMQGDRAMAVLFGNRVSLFLGDISYSIYMVHWPLIVLAMHFAPSAWKWGVAASLIPVATLSFRYVELPSRRWGRHLAGAWGRPAGLITAQSGPM